MIFFAFGKGGQGIDLFYTLDRLLTVLFFLFSGR